MRQIVLASTSQYRRKLIVRILPDITLAAPSYEEDMTLPMDPVTMVETFSEGKAMSLAEAFPDAIIIGSDQIMCCGDEVIGKPHTVENAEKQLKRLRGGTHRLLTGVSVVDASTKRRITSANQCDVTFRELTDQEIQNYVRRDQPLDCSGSFKVESLGIALFEKFVCDDPTAIEGLPLTHVTRHLLALGVAIL